MPFTRTFAGRAVRLRAAAAMTCFSIAALACNAEDATAPTSLDAESPVEAAAVQPAMEAYTSSTAPGVPFGDFHLPTSLYNAPYSGALLPVYTSSANSALGTAKSKGMRVVVSMAGNRSNYTNSDGTFNMSKWKSRVYAFKSVDFNSYVSAGTVVGHYLVDEPTCSGCWGGRSITTSQIEEMSRYSKSLWSRMPTGVRANPSKLGTTRFSSLDFAWAQWEGPLHGESFRLTPEQYRDKQVSRAQSLGLGLVFGLNYLDGGDGSSKINGTYYKDPNPYDSVRCPSGGSCYRYQMSAAEVRRVGGVLANASYGCALLSWKYNSTFLDRSGMRDAMKYVAAEARDRSRRSCVV